MSHCGVEREAEEHQLQGGRDDERERETPIAADLGEFLADQGAETR